MAIWFPCGAWCTLYREVRCISSVILLKGGCIFHWLFIPFPDPARYTGTAEVKNLMVNWRLRGILIPRPDCGKAPLISSSQGRQALFCCTVTLTFSFPTHPLNSVLLSLPRPTYRKGTMNAGLNRAQVFKRAIKTVPLYSIPINNNNTVVQCSRPLSSTLLMPEPSLFMGTR